MFNTELHAVSIFEQAYRNRHASSLCAGKSRIATERLELRFKAKVVWFLFHPCLFPVRPRPLFPNSLFCWELPCRFRSLISLLTKRHMAFTCRDWLVPVFPSPTLGFGCLLPTYECENPMIMQNMLGKGSMSAIFRRARQRRRDKCCPTTTLGTLMDVRLCFSPQHVWPADKTPLFCRSPEARCRWHGKL